MDKILNPVKSSSLEIFSELNKDLFRMEAGSWSFKYCSRLSQEFNFLNI
ncbi:hypothetical protein LEP1GSC198_0505 [Leptospira kirschneri str. JB]|nr:hypothetical protein LEP1GSC198_0505 [Leptospira kirschneri str. JB]